MRLALFPIVAAGLYAQGYSLVSPPNLHPGARIRLPVGFFGLLGSVTETVTATANGRDYILRNMEPFPAQEELVREMFRWPVYLIPHDLPPGIVTLRFDGRILQYPVSGQPYDEIYTIRDLTKTSIAYAQQQTATGPLRRNRFTDPAHPGDRITLWGTGLDRATVTVAGMHVAATLTHQSDGLDRIEFHLPENTPADCSLPVSVNRTSVTISTAEPGGSICPHRLGITPSDLFRLDRGQTIRAAAFHFSPKSISVQYGDFGIADVPVPAKLPSSDRVAAGCTVSAIPVRAPEGPGFPNVQSSGFPGPPFAVELISPSGARFPRRTYSNSVYGFSSPTGDDIWIPGKWTFRFLGQGPEPVDVTPRPPLRWNIAPDLANFTRDRDFVLTWDPSQGGPNEGVVFEHTQLAESPIDGIRGHKLTCTEPITSGRLVVSRELMRSIQWLPSSRPATTSVAVSLQPSISRAPDGRYIYVSY